MHHDYANRVAASCDRGTLPPEHSDLAEKRRHSAENGAPGSLNAHREAAEGHHPLASAVRLAIRVVLIGVICHVSTEIGFGHKLPPHNISVLWPTGAILFSVLVATPVRHWWAYSVAAYFTSVLNDARAGFPMAAVLFVAAGIIEILLATVCVRRLAAGLRAFDDLRSLVAYIIVAVVLGPFVSAFVAALAAATPQYWFYWRVWFLSEPVGDFTLAPAILPCIRVADTARGLPSKTRRVEACLVGCALLAVCVCVFWWPTADDGSVPALVYLPLPLLLWAAVRFGPPGVNVYLLIVALVSISGAVHGHGPFAAAGSDDNVVELQLFLVAVSVPLMFLAALIAEGREQTKVLSESEARFRSMADTAPVMIWMADATKRCNYFNKPWLDF